MLDKQTVKPNNERNTIIFHPESDIFQSSIQKILKTGSTIGFLEFLTGLGTTAIGNPSQIFLSGGKLVQAAAKGNLYNQLYNEIQEYRSSGKASEENLESPYGKGVFVDLMTTIDEENLDEVKFKALKSIFIKTILVGTDEHTQMLAYQYFQICKNLKSLVILVIQSSYTVYKEPGGNQREGGPAEWEVNTSARMGIPVDLVTGMRIEYSGANSNSAIHIFGLDTPTTRHGLTSLGIELGKFISENY